MPELPEVETIVRELKDLGVCGKTITHASIFWTRTLQVPAIADFLQLIAGQRIEDVLRRGKYIHFKMSNCHLIVHLRMTGKLLLRQGPPGKYERAALYFEDGVRLAFDDTRKFGRWYCVLDPNTVLGQLGVEPLGRAFTVEKLRGLCAGRRTAVKPFLLQQEHIAGLGNIYVDEALWTARIHPLTPVGSFADESIAALHAAIREVLKRGIATRGTTLGTGLGNYVSANGSRGEHQTRLNVFRRDGEPCPRCGTIIQRLVVAQRGTHICPRCQAEPAG